MTHAEALQLARQLPTEQSGWTCELMKEPRSDKWLLCFYHRERWEQFVRWSPEPYWTAKQEMPRVHH